MSNTKGISSKIKIISAIIICILIPCILVITVGNKNKPKSVDTAASSSVVSKQAKTVKKSVDAKQKAKPKKETVKKENTPSSKPDIAKKSISPKDCNDNIDIEDNVFLDALAYTGYSLEKTRADGKMWVYVLCDDKPALGWLSKITYGGGCSGYETTADGKPNIAAFEQGGLVCASFATYVYFNYLPNVVGIDTSSLTRPADPVLANEWKKAAEDWVAKGYSHEIEYDCQKSGHSIYFAEKEYMPIGTILLFRDDYEDSDPNSTIGSHVAIYIGTVNGYHWCIHVGNKNGPEMCAIERMNFGPDPQMPLKIISTPYNIRMAAQLDIECTDGEKPLDGVELSATDSKGNNYYIGATNKKGKVSRSGLPYGKYTISDGKTVKKINLTAENNSYNYVEFKR